MLRRRRCPPHATAHDRWPSGQDVFDVGLRDLVPCEVYPVTQPARPDEAAPGVEALGERIADLAARIQAAIYELLVLVRQFDERDGWEGFASCAHWLSWRVGLAPGAAREKVRVAHALG